ncbi:MAG: hypothetical protein LRY55_07250 [Leadbetterella sp.]|nr:hypothetical protein [Leadbetterella sp.]
MAAYEHVNDGQLFAVIANHFVTGEQPGKAGWMIERMQLMEGMDLYQYLGLLASYLVISDVAELNKGIPFIRDTAIHGPVWFSRMSAVRVLYTLKDLSEEAAKAFSEAVEAEKDERLINYYKQFNVER